MIFNEHTAYRLSNITQIKVMSLSFYPNNNNNNKLLFLPVGLRGGEGSLQNMQTQQQLMEVFYQPV